MTIIKDRQEWDDVLDFWFPEERMLNVDAQTHHAHWRWRMQGGADDAIIAWVEDQLCDALGPAKR